MSEQPEPRSEEPDQNQTRGNLSLEDALFVASDPKIKEDMNWGSANQRVARMLSEGVANGESAIPGIKQRAELARTALGLNQDGTWKLKRSFSDWFGKRAAEKELKRQHHNANMLIYDDLVASKAGYSGRGNPYDTVDRMVMSPDGRAKAELAKAQEASYAAEHADRSIDTRIEELLDRKAASTKVLEKLDNQLGRKPAQLELQSGESWRMYNEMGAFDPNATAASMLATIRDTPELQELVAAGMKDVSKEK